jgi:hypothetical protein
MPPISPEEFRRSLSEAKQRVLEKAATRQELIRLFLLSRRGFALAGLGHIEEDEAHQMSMVLFFAELGENFHLETILKSLRTSVDLIQKPLETPRESPQTFLELYVEPGCSFDELLVPSGNGIFLLSSILMNSSPLRDRYGKSGSREKLHQHRRWAVPLVYILSRVVHEVLCPQTADDLIQLIQKMTNKLFRVVISSRDAGIGLFLTDLIVSDARPRGLSLDFLIKTLGVKW